MAPPKKGTKMDLGSFLADDSLGGSSWADEEVDLNTIGVAVSTSALAPSGSSHTPSSNYSSMNNGGFREGQRERKEYPVPDQPPYRVKVSNLPWELDEASLAGYFENVMELNDIIEDIDLPVDRDSGRLKGFAFITFKEREVLEESLKVSTSEFQGRRIFVNVAAPPRNNGFDNDWRSGRSGPLDGGREPRREEPILDWGAARNSQASLPQRERPERTDRPRRERPQKDEPDLDWGSARGQGELPPRERPERTDRPRRERPQKDEPELDWGSARGQGELPPRERPERTDRPRRERPQKEEPELDWGSARGQALPPRERSFRKKTEPELDWVRGQTVPKKTNKAAAKPEAKKEEQIKPQKSSFSVLAVDDDEDKEEEKEEEVKEQTKPEEQATGLETATANLTVTDTDGWEVVGK